MANLPNSTPDVPVIQYKKTNTTAKNLDQINFLVLGESGSGKSMFASTFPSPAFVFDFDKQIAVYSNVEFDYEQYPNTAQGAKQFTNTLKLICSDNHYKSVIFDSLTTLQDLMLTLALATYPKREDETGLPIWRSHGSMARTYLEAALDKLRSRPGYNLTTGHLETVKDEMTGKILVQPNLIGKLATNITKYYGECYNSRKVMDNNVEKYKLLTRTSGVYSARSNLSGKMGKVPQLIDNDFSVLMGYLTA